MTSQPAARPWADAVFATAGKQPDQRSCGAACLVVARMLANPGLAHRVRQGGWNRAVLGTHRHVVGLTAPLHGRLPWVRALGTPPWTLARELSSPATPYRTVATLGGPRNVTRLVTTALDSGHPVAWYVGTRWLPRHVVLVVGHQGDAWLVWDPASGQVLTMPASALEPGPRRIAGWRTSWAVVAPRISPRPSGRRTPA